MRIYLSGASGGIGSAIAEILNEHEFVGVPQYKQEPQDVDWLIFSAGMINEEKIEETFAINTAFPLSVTQQWLPHIRQGIIYISSTAAITCNSKFPIYSASKAAVNCYAKAMAKKHPELQFYALCPGPTDTKMWRSLGLEGNAQDPKEVAKAVKEIMDGKFKSGDIITVRNGEICLQS